MPIALRLRNKTLTPEITIDCEHSAETSRCDCKICTDCAHSGSLGMLEKSHLRRNSHHANSNPTPCTLKPKCLDSHHANCNLTLCMLKPKGWRLRFTPHAHTNGPSIFYIKYQPLGKEYSDWRVFLLSNRNNTSDFSCLSRWNRDFLCDFESFYAVSYYW